MEEIFKMSIDEMNKKVYEIREILIETVSRNGGHLSSNLGIVELTLALHKVFDFSKDRLIFDVGHQSYVHKLLTGRDKEFSTLRQRGGIGPFSDPKESNTDPFISGHAGTGLSAGAGIAMASPEKKVVVVVGDAAISNGHSLEALNNIGGNKLKNMIVILNDNEMSIGENVGSLSKFFGKFMVSEKYMNFRDDIKGLIKKLKADKFSDTLERVEFSVKNFFLPLNMLESLGFKFFGVLDGHNLEELISTFNKIKNINGPIFIHIKTQKGKGYSYAEKDKEKFHGISPFDMKTGNTASSVKTYSSIFGSEIVRLAQEDEKIYTICSGMVKGTGLGDFFKKFPERAIDTGIAEGHAVTFAGGLATQGKKPYVAIYSTFLQRAYSQLIHDISLQKLPVRFIVDRAGIVGEDGKTHNGLYDLSIFLTIPNYTVLVPSTSKELVEMLEFSRDFESGPLVIRIPREVEYNVEDAKEFKFGKWTELRKGKDNLFIAIGSMVKEILDIEDNLKARGIEGTIVNASTVRPLDEKYLLESVKEYKNIFVLEEAYEKNSFGSSIIEFFNERNIGVLVRKIALKEGAIPHGKRSELLEEFGLRGENLIKRIEEKINGGKK
ncbi:1-deoxy-D-xylulose-5-phosphate synthase [Fusobacterium necrogenes]|uniref:1-deoxy-D-xylulose-5-phosphate synthase n=1 Tax=Fusobacterium necrogenes TaxID=858 RepID=A0A377GVL4_9FUSO|nr:1-deoxy-D-xylulose-5-phosphate synthase [Fusobacterium necrogenes]STO30883.1 1-deoxy-D-xylulose-5-phosphate synthase [Fusobacterium necrogenes]